MTRFGVVVAALLIAARPVAGHDPDAAARKKLAEMMAFVREAPDFNCINPLPRSWAFDVIALYVSVGDKAPTEDEIEASQEYLEGLRTKIGAAEWCSLLRRRDAGGPRRAGIATRAWNRSMSDDESAKKSQTDIWRRALEVSASPPRSSRLSIDPSEFLALRVVVGVLIGMLAKKDEPSTGQPAQQFVNSLSELCQEALLTATFSDVRLDADKLRRDAIEHVNKIVGTVRFDDNRTGSN
jgi:hypothetical protein